MGVAQFIENVKLVGFGILLGNLWTEQRQRRERERVGNKAYVGGGGRKLKKGERGTKTKRIFGVLSCEEMRAQRWGL